MAVQSAATVHLVLDANAARFMREFNKAARSFQKDNAFMRREATQTSSAMTAAFAQIKSATAILAGALGARQIVEYSDAWQRLENRLKVVTLSYAELIATENKVIDIARSTRSSLNGTGELYARLARSTEDLSISQERLFGVTTAINQAIQVSGATFREAENGIIQLAQGIASGKLAGDELRAVLEQMPRLAIAIADGLGVPLGKLRELGKEGALTTEKVLSAIEQEAPRIAAEFETFVPTIQQTFTQIENDLILKIGKPLSEVLRPAVAQVADEFREWVDVVSSLETIWDGVGALSLGALNTILYGIREIEVALLRLEGLAVKIKIAYLAVRGELPNESDAQKFARLSKDVAFFTARVKELEAIDSPGPFDTLNLKLARDRLAEARGEIERLPAAARRLAPLAEAWDRVREAEERASPVLRDTIRNLEQNIEEKQRALNAILDSVKGKKLSVFDEQVLGITDLRAELNSLQADYARVVQANAAMQKQVTRAQSAITASAQRMTGTDYRFDAEQPLNELGRLQQRYDEIDATIRDLNSRSFTGPSDAIRGLIDQQGQLTAGFGATQSAFANLEKTLKSPSSSSSLQPLLRDLDGVRVRLNELRTAGVVPDNIGSSTNIKDLGKALLGAGDAGKRLAGDLKGALSRVNQLGVSVNDLNNLPLAGLIGSIQSATKAASTGIDSIASAEGLFRIKAEGDRRLVELEKDTQAELNRIAAEGGKTMTATLYRIAIERGDIATRLAQAEEAMQAAGKGKQPDFEYGLERAKAVYKELDAINARLQKNTSFGAAEAAIREYVATLEGAKDSLRTLELAANAQINEQVISGRKEQSAELLAIEQKMVDERVRLRKSEAEQLAVLRGDPTFDFDEEKARAEETERVWIATFESLSRARAKFREEGFSGLDASGDSKTLSKQLNEQIELIRANDALKYEQGVTAQAELYAALAEGEAAYNVEALRLAEEFAKQKVELEFAARIAALEAAGQPIDQDTRLAMEAAEYEERLRLYKEFLDSRRALEENGVTKSESLNSWLAKAEKRIGKERTGTLKDIGTAWMALTQNNEKAARIQFRVNQAIAIGEAIMWTYAAANRALASVPFPANIAAAALITALGIANVASIASASPGGGGGGGSGGGAALPPEQSGGFQFDEGNASRNAVQIVFQGPVYGWDQYIEERVIQSIRDAVDSRDVVIIGGGSRQAADIRGG